MTMTKSPVSTWEVKIALCLPRSSTAAFSATRPTTWLSASIIYHLRSTSSALALKVFIGSRKLSHAPRDVSKIFAVIFKGCGAGQHQPHDARKFFPIQRNGHALGQCAFPVEG